MPRSSPSMTASGQVRGSSFLVPHAGHTIEPRKNAPVLVNRVRQNRQVSSQRDSLATQWSDRQVSVRTALIASSLS